MTNRLKPYPVMKDSGLKWLGEIPEHWEIRRNGRLFAQRNETGYSDLPVLEVSLRTGVRVRDFKNSNRKQVMSDRDKYKRALTGDIAYNMMRMWQGAVGVAPVDGLISPAYVVAHPLPDTDAHYYEKLFRTPAYMQEVDNYSRGIVKDRNRLYWEYFKAIPTCCPPPEEQTAIVRYLDYMDRRVRRLIQAKRKLIALLTEQKQAIIHRAVTRGLDPDVPLKDSGVEWLGKIPDSWHMTTVRRLISFITSGSRGWAAYYSDSGDIFLQSGNLGRSMAVNMKKIQHVLPPEGAEGRRTTVYKDDILVCVTGALTGNVVHVHEEIPHAYINQHVALLRPYPSKVSPRYLAYILHSSIGQSQFKSKEYGGTKQGLGLDDVRDVYVVLPGMEEQQALVESIDRKTSQIRTTISILEQEIDLIREYRTRMVADVVTGKLDVREAVARLPDEPEDNEPIGEIDEVEDLAEDMELEESED